MFGPDGMSIGLGIFLASLYLGTIYLYVQTRDRWNWSRMISRFAVLVFGAAVGGVLIYGAHVGYGKWESRLRVQTAVGPVAIGEPWADVVYKLGKFKDEDRSRAVTRRPGETWHSHETLPLSVNVWQGRVHYVVYHCRDWDKDVYGAFNGIRCGDDGAQVMSRFSGKVRVLCRQQPELAHLRAYDVVEYGTRYIMASNKVSSIGVANSADLATFSGINWHACGAPELELRGPDEAKAKDEAGPVPVKTSPAQAKTTSGK